MSEEKSGPKTLTFDGSARALAKQLVSFRAPDTARALFELSTTILPFILLWGAMAFAVETRRPFLMLLLVAPAAGLVVRLFLIQHDCGHGSFFKTRAANDWTGRLLSVVTLTPYDYWRRTHALHHASSGNLAARGIGDIDTLTVAEYLARSRWGRLRYRLYRHPVIMFGVGPAFLFGLQYRVPVGLMRHSAPWFSTMATNVGIATIALLVIWRVGLATFLTVQLPVTCLGATIGVWLFYVQHQFEATHWTRPPRWDVHEASLHGSSHYDLPLILRWFTANVGVHHVHHLVSRVPFYRLPDVLRRHPELRKVGRLTLQQSLACVGLVLWSEQESRMVSFQRAVQQPVPDGQQKQICATPESLGGERRRTTDPKQPIESARLNDDRADDDGLCAILQI